MKNLIKNNKIITLAGIILMAGFLAPTGFANAFASFNNDSLDKPTLRVSNYTKNPDCSTCWSSSVSADAGDIVSFDIYYHNTSSETANDVKIKINLPSGSFTSRTITANLWAQNASVVTGGAAVNLSSSQTLTFIPDSVRWYPNQSLSAQFMSGSEIVGTGLNIGNISFGWPSQGHVVARAQVSNIQPSPSPSPSPSPTPTPVCNKPSVYTSSVSNITQSSATLRGSADPNGGNTAAWFEWGASETGLNYETTHQNMGNGDSSIDYLAGLSGLSANTVYYYRSFAGNACGISYGSTKSFTTKIEGIVDGGGGGGGGGGGSCLPIVTTNSASFITKDSASLRALINPQGRSTSGWFEYGQSYALTFRTTTTHVGSGNSDTDLLRYLPNLQPNTTYYFRAIAENNCGKAQGSILSFTTEPGIGNKPEVITLPASSITQSAAVINGEINPKSFDSVGWLEWGTDSSLNSRAITPSVNLGAVDSKKPISSQLYGLSNNTTYYFRAAARNDYGTAYGSILSFTTSVAGVIAPPSVGGGANFSVWKEIKNLTFPNGTIRINASFIGDTLEYYLNIKNNQTAELKNILVKDIIDSRFEFIEADPKIDSSSSGDTLYWKIDSIKPGETIVIAYRIKTKTVEESYVIPNIFKAEAGGVSRISNEATTILNPSLMSLDISSDKNHVNRNEEFVYIIRYRNIGIADVDNALLKVALPADVAVSDIDKSNYTQEGNVLFFDIGRVNKNESGTINVKVKVNEDANSGENMIATAVLDFTDVFGDPQPNISVSVVVAVESGFFGLSSAIGGLGKIDAWLWLVMLLISAFVFGIFYTRYKITKMMKA